MPLKLGKDYSDALIEDYYNTVSSSDLIHYSPAVDSFNWADTLNNILTNDSEATHEDITYVASLIRGNSIVEGSDEDPKIRFTNIVDLINGVINLDPEEKLKVWNLINTIINSKHNRAGMKDGRKSWMQRLADFINSYFIECAIKDHLSKNCFGGKLKFDFTDKYTHDYLWETTGDNITNAQPDLTCNNITFEIKPKWSNASLHDAIYVIRYTATTTEVTYWFTTNPDLSPTKYNNLNLGEEILIGPENKETISIGAKHITASNIMTACKDLITKQTIEPKSDYDKKAEEVTKLINSTNRLETELENKIKKAESSEEDDLMNKMDNYLEKGKEWQKTLKTNILDKQPRVRKTKAKENV